MVSDIRWTVDPDDPQDDDSLDQLRVKKTRLIEAIERARNDPFDDGTPGELEGAIIDQMQQRLARIVKRIAQLDK